MLPTVTNQTDHGYPIIAAKKNDVTADHRYSPLDRSRRLKRVEADRTFQTP